MERTAKPPRLLMERAAVFSPDRVYRYRLGRTWGMPQPRAERRVAFVMLNPSTADETVEDPTVRRCIGFARAWGYDRLDVLNLFALRSTDPRALREHPDPVGPENDRHIADVTAVADLVIAAWGNHGALRGRGAEVFRLLVPQALCLGVTGAGQPRHPLYVSGSAELVGVPLPVPAEADRS